MTVEEERHPDGTLAKRAFRRDGKLEGLFQEWYPDGTTRLVAEWREDKGEGVWMYFHPNGSVSERSYVTNDIWHGPSEGWHANGIKAFEGTFEMGYRAGLFRRWDEAGEQIGPWSTLLPEGNDPTVVLDGFWPEGFNAWDITFSPDLETVFVGTGDNEGNNRSIMMRRWTKGGWTDLEPAPFADLSAAEGTPKFSHDGRHVYFSSDRQAATEPDNPRREMYRVSHDGGWKTVERMTHTPLYGEVSLVTAEGGQGVLWTDRQLDGTPRIGLYEVVLDPAGTNLTIVMSLNDLHSDDASGEAYPVLSPDGRTLLFSNFDIAGEGTQEDLYITHRSVEGWKTPVRLSGPFFGPGNDTAVQFIDGGRALVFSRSATGPSRTYVIPSAALPSQ